MTYKNIGDKPFMGECEMINFGIKSDLSSSDNTNAAKSFDSIGFFEGEVQPGETREAEFIADIYNADESYYGTGSGAVAAGYYDEISRTI